MTGWGRAGPLRMPPRPWAYGAERRPRLAAGPTSLRPTPERPGPAKPRPNTGRGRVRRDAGRSHGSGRGTRPGWNGERLGRVPRHGPPFLQRRRSRPAPPERAPEARCGAQARSGSVPGEGCPSRVARGAGAASVPSPGIRRSGEGRRGERARSGRRRTAGLGLAPSFPHLARRPAAAPAKRTSSPERRPAAKWPAGRQRCPGPRVDSAPGQPQAGSSDKREQVS